MSQLTTTITASGGGTPLIFSDDFASGDFSHTGGGVSWSGGATNCVVSNQKANGGTYSAKFTFTSIAGAWAELRFALGALYREVIVQFDLYIPNGSESYGGAAFTIRSTSPSNNKLIRLWETDYDNFDIKVGASTDQGSIALAFGEWGVNASGVGPGGPVGAGPETGYANLILAGDRGTWITVKYRFQAATSANNDGVIQIYKNGSLLVGGTAFPFYPGAGQNNGVNLGYLLGWANSGFAATTYLFIDNVSIYARV